MIFEMKPVQARIVTSKISGRVSVVRFQWWKYVALDLSFKFWTTVPNKKFTWKRFFTEKQYFRLATNLRQLPTLYGGQQGKGC